MINGIIFGGQHLRLSNDIIVMRNILELNINEQTGHGAQLCLNGFITFCTIHDILLPNSAFTMLDMLYIELSSQSINIVDSSI